MTPEPRQLVQWIELRVEHHRRRAYIATGEAQGPSQRHRKHTVVKLANGTTKHVPTAKLRSYERLR